VPDKISVVLLEFCQESLIAMFADSPSALFRLFDLFVKPLMPVPELLVERIDVLAVQF
jgi:hypothetical protein